MPQDRKDLKILALREALRGRVSEITDSYEDRVSDLRIEITELHEKVQELTIERDALRDAVEDRNSNVQEDPDVVPGEVVD